MIKLQLIGHLGRDVVKREINGVTVFSFPVAVNERFKNALGILQERTTWVDCSLWDRENLAPYLNQGVMVYVEGSPRVEAYVSNTTGALSGALRLRVSQLQLLSRKDEEKRKAAVAEAPLVPETDPVEEQPADDLPF
ncbi:single-stranded DNA-binding protein [Chitinophaga nivalis]|uniref:Single-stranded DNA-binding protein n=1 Tax=Chitinophaga nivalis TaxID=2991709 RepID=A0ABT3IRV2_9BACT|nr:single-stranded DNA-binding protein [Chitinophaga nivalis]MCW3463636.1 single-stranded DNA-binding protein [Chitinophaga nivalis]MCW3486674.1 single-stranded DNA-binding protein [Chitinophaga nivalis]